MLPNQFVILWDDIPVGLAVSHIGRTVPIRVENIHQVLFFQSAIAAHDWMSQFSHATHWTVKEIQFKIMDKE